MKAAPITTRIVLLFLVMATVLLATVGLLSYRSGSDSLKSAAISMLNAEALEKEAAVEAWINERLDDIQQTAAAEDVVEKAAALVAATPATPDARSAYARLQIELRPHVAGSGAAHYTEWFVLEPVHGKVVASTNPSEEGGIKAGEPYFDHGKSDLYLQISDYSASSAGPAMTAAIPLRATDGRVVAVLGARLNAAEMDAMVRRQTGLYQTEDAYLINSDGFLISQPRFLKRPADMRRKLNTEAVRLCLTDHSGVTLAPDSLGVPSIAFYRWNPRRQLGLIVKIDQVEALAPARAFGQSVILISMLSVVASAILAFLMARSITRPLLALTARVRRFGERGHEEPAHDFARDEVGLLKVEFDRMAARIADHTAELAHANDALQTENAERREVLEVLRAANATLSRECEARQQAEDALATNEEMQRAIFERSHEALMVLSPPDWKFTSANTVTLDLFGAKDLGDFTARDPSELSTERQPDGELSSVQATRMIMEALETGSALFEWTHRKITGEVFPATVMLTRIESEGKPGLQAMVRDLTEQKRAEKELRESKRFAESIALSSTSIIYLFDLDSQRITYSNRNVGEVLGYSAAQIIELGENILPAILHPDAPPLVAAHHAQLRELSDDRALEIEYRVKHADGEWHWLWAREKVFRRRPDGKAWTIMGTAHDITERKRAEDELRIAHAQLEQMVAHSPAVTYRLKLDGQRAVANAVSANVTELLGFTPAECLSHEWWLGQLHPDDRDRAIASISETMSRGLGRSEFRLRRKLGDYRWVENNQRLIRDESGQPQEVIGVWIDITERRSQDEKLRWQTALLEAQVNSTPDGILVVDNENKQILKNERFNAVWKIPREMAEEQDDQETLEFAVSQVKNPKGFAERVKFLYEHPDEVSREELELVDGTVLDRYSAPVRDKAGRHFGRIWTFRDITERKKAVESIKLFRALVDRSNDAFEVIDAQTARFIDASERAHEDLGYTREEFLQLHSFDINPCVPEAMIPAIRAQLREKGSITHEGIHRRKDGSDFPVEVKLRRVMLDREYVIAAVRDISDRKQNEALMESLNRQLVTASREAGMAEVATNVLHNVGNVLNSANISLSVATDKVRDLKLATLDRLAALLRSQNDLAAFFTTDPRGAELPAFLHRLAEHLGADRDAVLEELDAVRQHVEHINEIVAMQQNYASACGVTEVLPLSNLIDDALRLNAGAIARHGLQVVREYAELPPAAVDRHKLLQILVNLIRNAKYALDDCAPEEKRLTLSLGLSQSGRAQITVRDNGVGIPAENLIRIFEHGFTTRKNGHGFGLHSSANAAREMGGTLIAQSDGPGRGAVFTIELPLEPPAKEL